ncbi:MAG: hypothetical protein WKF82_06370 [Nocardioidaceae bacterium]
MAVELVAGDVKVAVRRDRHGVRPPETRVVGERFPGTVGPTTEDSVLLASGHVEVRVGISLQTVGHTAFVTLVLHRCRDRFIIE